VLEITGVLPGGARYGEGPGILEIYMHVAIFFVVGAVGGYLADRIRLKGTQLQNAESELKQLKIDTDNILNQMSSGVLLVDSTGKIVSINPAAEQILEVDRDDVQNLDLNAAFESLMPELANELMAALRLNTSKMRHEMTIKRPSGMPLPLGISISLLKDESGKQRGAIAVFQNLTETRQMQERMRKADRLAAIGELSAGIAHEIRNPLASISGSIEMLYNELALDGEDKRLMELVMKESDHLDRIISDFLEFAGLRHPSKDEVRVPECIEDVLILLRNNAEFRCRIKTDIQPDCAKRTACFDEEQIKQVFVNLALNASQAMPDDGCLVIGATIDEEDWLHIAFLDEGPGISAEVRSRLFEPFFTTKDGGTGLGLAIANKIVEIHGGRIEVKNRESGGAAFTIVMPLDARRVGAENKLELSSVGVG
jgi:two-component system sensor histidine kinase PilS (NtrC family)